MAEKNSNNHLAIGELPLLRVLPIEKLVFHEEPDEERLLTLVSRLGGEGILKNPPIVARFGDDGQYVILDGANRVTALTKLGFKHLVIQLVEFASPTLNLYCWNHAVERLELSRFCRKIRKMSGVDLRDGFAEQTSGAADRQDRHSICRLTSCDGDTVSVVSNGGVLEQVRQLQEIASLYTSTSFYDRVSYTNLDHLRHNYPEFATLITFRIFSKEDFLEIVGAGLKLPAGVTRVFLPKRALGLNIPLELLKSGLTQEELNHWLEEMILRKVREKSIRFYREPTFVFDE